MDPLIVTQAINVLYGISTLAVLALGLAVIFGLLGVLNIAHGEFVMIGAYCAYVTQAGGLPYLAAVPLTLAVCAVVGVTVELRVQSHHVDVALTGTAIRPAGGARRAVRGRGAKSTPKGGIFVSDLSARDFTLLHRAGWEPLGLAAGASFVVAPRRSARQWAAQKSQNVELTNLTEALYLAREGAMARMQEAGIAMGADGVVAVKLREGPIGRGARAMQFVAVGTAVRLGEDDHRPLEPEMVVPLTEVVRQFEVTSLRSAP